MANLPEIRCPSMLEIATYVPGKSTLAPGQKVIKLSSNENPFGASPAAYETLRQCDYLHRYPEGSSRELREALGNTYGLNPERIVCGAGSDELILLLAQAYATTGDEILCTEHSFLMYPIAAKRVGAVPVYAKETDMTTSVDALLASVTPKTRMVFLANPNNPTGTYLSQTELRRLRDRLRDDILLVLDHAYAEYATAENYTDGYAFVEEGRTVVTRTFSKIYGLAALRLGWAYCPESVADILHRIRGPFNVSTLAQSAGIAALKDQDFIRHSCEHNHLWRERLTQTLQQLGLNVYSSQANFILVAFPEGTKNAQAADTFLQQQGIIVRNMQSYDLPHCLR
ncbi:MAG: histidinol-phosphate transaminase, partial [Rickettsiales bacterium]|nr:histidinol-phosphate transaminase [Rickettsiales bacterium]